MPDPQTAAKTAADLYLQLGIYGFIAVAFVLLCLALIWYLIRQWVKSQGQFIEGLDGQRKEHTAAMNSLGDKHGQALEKVATTFEKTNQVLRQEIVGKVDALAGRIDGLDCQRPARPKSGGACN